MQKRGSRGRIAEHLRGNVVGYVAVFLALAGTAVALPGRNTVDSGDIINGEVKRRDLAAGSVSTSPSGPAGGHLAGSYPNPLINPAAFASGDIALQGDVFGIAPNAVQSAEVSANALTGADIDEASLAEVPSAGTAGDLDSVDIQPIEFLVNENTPAQTVLPRTLGLRIRASCSSGGDLEVIADTDRNSRLFTWAVDSGIVGDPQLNNEIAGENFVAGSTQDLVYDEEGDQSGQTTYMTVPGGVVIVTWASDEGSTSGFTRQCVFIGTAISH